MSQGSFSIDTVDGSPRLTLIGEIDHAVADEMTDAVLDELCTDGELSVDVSGVKFIDSTGLSMLLRVRNACPHVRLLGVPNPVHRLLAITGLTSMFNYGTAPSGRSTAV